MLPSKGYFKNIVCPYFEGGLCERPHCHFRHVRKDKTETLSPTEEETTQEQSADLDSCERSILTQLGSDDFYVLDKADDVEEKANTADNEDLVSHIVKELKPPPSKLYLPPPNTPSYKPTPIAELKKRHIPVPNPIVRSSSSAPHSKNNLKVSHKKSKIEYVPELSKRQEALLMNVYSPTPASILKENEIFGSDNPVTTTTTTTGSAEVPLEMYKVSNKTDSQHISKLPSYSPQNSVYNSDYKLNDKEYSCPAESETVDESMDLDSVDLSNELNLIGEILEEENVETEDEEKKDEVPANVVKTVESTNKSEICSALSEMCPKDAGNCTVGTDSKSISKETTENCDRKVNLLSEDDTENKDKKEKKEFKSSKDHKISNQSDLEKKHVKTKTEHAKSEKPRKEGHSRSDSSKYSSNKKDHNHHKKEKNLSSKTESSRIDHKKHDSVEKHSKKTEKFCKEDKSEQIRKTYKKGHKYINDQKHSEEGKRKSSDHCSDRTKRAKVSHSKESHRRRHDDRRSCTKNLAKKTSDSSDSEDIVIISDDNGTPIVITDSEDESKPSDDTATNEKIVEEEQSTAEESAAVEESKDQEPQVREKKRVARAGSGNTSASWTGTNKRKNFPSASESMLARWKQLKEGQSSKADAQLAEVSEAQPSGSQQGRMRIAHVPNVASLLNAKRKIIEEKSVSNFNKHNQFQNRQNMFSETRHSYSGNMDDEDAAVTCPLVSGDSKFPVVGRQIYLQKLFEAFCQHFTRKEASDKAVEKELEICNRVASFVVYKQSVASAVYQIRKLPDPAQSKQDAERNSKFPEYTYGLSLYSCFKKYLLTDDELQNNNYPLNHPEQPGSAYTLPSSRRSAKLRQCDDNMYECIKCRQIFEVDERGFSVQVGECCYHWGSVYRIKEKGTFVAKYVCCGYELGSKPCTTGKYHVTEMRDEDCMPGFTEMPPPSEDIPEEDLGIYALDCEMCYTTYGLELTRVTVINTDLEVVYNKLVMPDNEIIDYNTRFSGITEDIIQGCKTKLADVHEDLKKMFSSKTILVGHSLESDLKALKIIHSTVVDTSVAFPHRMGPPNKLSLRRLAADILQKIIQENEAGHDSAEDARTCMELMIYKIKGDCSKYKPRKVVSYSGKGKHG